MRSLDLLVRSYPNKTAAEILQIMEEERQVAQQQFENTNKANIDWMNEININGGYFKGRFGLYQRFYYKVTDVTMEGKELFGTVSKVVVFLGGSILHEPKIEVCTKTFQKLENYGFGMYTRTTKMDWDEVDQYIRNIEKFWKDLEN
jgi:hypothetical protein